MILSENHLFVCTSLSSGGETDVSYPVLIQHALARSDKKKKKKTRKGIRGIGISLLLDNVIIFVELNRERQIVRTKKFSKVSQF